MGGMTRVVVLTGRVAGFAAMLLLIAYGLVMTQVQPWIANIWLIYSASMLVVMALWLSWARRVAASRARRSE